MVLPHQAQLVAQADLAVAAVVERQQVAVQGQAAQEYFTFSTREQL
jgi:hypothetical protein